jgi:O-antigen/teichoic acid export membrane protein
MTRDLASLLVVLVCFVAVKLSLLVYYIARHHGLKAPLFNRAALLDQIRHAAPFGMSGALNQLRAQGDQWVVASLFAVGQFAAFSVASVLSSITYLLRQSVNNVFLPQMSMMQANGDIAEMLALNNKANTSVSFIVYPLLAFCFAFADTIVTLVYTSAYAQGGAVMRVYIIGLLAFIIELNSVMLLYRQGAFAMWTNMLMLMACIPASYFGAKAYGLPGAAIGSVVVAFLERIITLWRIAALTSVAVSRLQDWKSISKILLAATLAGLAATVLNDSDILSRHGVPMLLAGGLVVCGLYALLVRVLGLAWIFRGFVARRV